MWLATAQPSSLTQPKVSNEGRWKVLVIDGSGVGVKELEGREEQKKDEEGKIRVEIISGDPFSGSKESNCPCVIGNLLA